MNKRLVILFSALTLIVVLVLLFGVVFIVRDIEVVFHGEAPVSDAAKIVEDSKLRTGAGIFTLSAQKATANIEAANAYARVESIERKFPNKVVITLSKRSPMFSMPVDGSSEYLILDRDLKVLDVATSADTSLSLITGYFAVADHTNLGASIGIFLDADNNVRYARLKEIVLGFISIGFTESEFLSFVDSVYLGHESISVLNTEPGVKIEITGTQNIQMQVAYAYAFYESLPESKQKVGSIKNDGNGWRHQY